MQEKKTTQTRTSRRTRVKRKRPFPTYVDPADPTRVRLLPIWPELRELIGDLDAAIRATTNV